MSDKDNVTPELADMERRIAFALGDGWITTVFVKNIAWDEGVCFQPRPPKDVIPSWGNDSMMICRHKNSYHVRKAGGVVSGETIEIGRGFGTPEKAAKYGKSLMAAGRLR